MADDKPFEICRECGTPKLPDAHCLVLYFPSVEDCREAAEALKEVLPTARSYIVE